MPRPRWNRAKQVFHEALDKNGPERARFVAAACGDDAELRAQVEGLLTAHEEAGTFMASPTGPGTSEVARAAAVAPDLPREAPGTRVGPYKLLQVIGEGGFGVVYMAEQEQPIRRRVALKIIKLGMDTKGVIARFEAERQALAMMDHPNIARVLDAGATASGRPYFVMELVKGVPITAYCDANHLTTRERLDLFADVCKAIHHAHEKGIIHRDVKPSNVMVTLHDARPVPKIIDFGVAKATNQRLTEKTLFTAYGEFVGTPAYMSPEQAELSGLEIDCRSDVYSLGVLLYELLTGTTPLEADSLRARGFLEMMRIIREEDPPTPSARLHTLGSRLIDVASRRQVEPHALEKQVRGDLDWIVMKALEKDRRRRYGSASELGNDLARYFRDEPVTARRPSAGYRFAKLARRRRAAFLAAMGIVIAIGFGGLLARVIGSRSVRSILPRARLILDLNARGAASVPTRDGLHHLRYNAAGRGYEVVEIASGKPTSPLINAGAPFRGPDIWPGRILAPDKRLIVFGGPPTDGSQPVLLRLFSVGGSDDGRVLHQWERDVRWAEPFAWSPTSKHVWVYVNHADKTLEIASVGVQDGSLRIAKTLAWRGPGSVHASLSPDGRFLAYDYSDTPATPRDIFLVSTDSAQETRVPHPANDSHPLFTPDGAGIVFQSDREGGAVWFLPVVNGRPASEPRVVWDELGLGGQLMQFAENGALFYHAAGVRWGIHAADIDLDRRVVDSPQLIPARDGEPNNAPAFSPDGRFLAHLRGAGRRLVLHDLVTRGEREFPVSGPMAGAAIDFCPNGQTVVVAGYESTPGSRGTHVYRVDLQLGGAERLRVTPADFGRVACIGDGGEVVYVTAPDPRGMSQIVRHSLVTGEVTTLFDGAQAGVTRSADGKMIVFSARVGDRSQWFVMPTNGGKAAQVGVSPTMQASPRPGLFSGEAMWLPNGRELLVVRPTDSNAFSQASPEVEFLRVPVDGGAPTQIGRLHLPPYQDAPFGSRHYDLHPTASRVVFERHGGTQNQVWVIDNLLPFIQSGATASVRLRR